MFSSGTPAAEPWRTFVDASPDGIIVVDPAERIQYANPSAERLFGYTEGELEERPIGALIPERLRAEHGGHFRRFIEDPEARPMGTAMELYGLRSDGTEFPIDVSLTAIRVAGCRYVAAAIRDTTELLQAHRKLLQADKLEAVRRLSGGLAHEFNNLLTAIQGSAELARDELPSEHPARGDLSQIRRSVGRCRDLVRALLAFSQMPREEREVPVDLGELIQDLRSALESLISEDVDLDVRLGDAPLSVRIAPVLLRQILVDLVVNADDAMPEGGRLRILSRHDRGPTRRVTDTPEGEAVLVVEDTGVGIPPEHRERIFDPFFSTKSSKESVGLGLSAVHGIVRRAGGTIDVTSEPGKGSTFTIRLPLVE